MGVLMVTIAVRFFYFAFYWTVPLWYGLTLNLTRVRRWPPLPRFYNVREIAQELDWGQHWRPDPLKGMLDVLMDPRKMQARIDDGDREFGDCDDHALYWATALLQSGLADRAWLGTVWYGRGHVVCVFENKGLSYWTDYGLPTTFQAPWAWAYDVAARYGKLAQHAGLIEVVLREHNGAPRLRFVRGLSRKTRLA